MKKIFSLIVALVMTITLATPVTAQEIEQPSFTVSSPSFPDAYIITEVTPAFQFMDGASGSLGAVSATVFIEESYDMIDGEVTITDSRLLSEDEVLAIGVENFNNLGSSATPRAATNSRGKLTITFSGIYNTSNGVSCDLTATANWDMSGISINISGENVPAIGEDFIGVTWSGAFTSKSHSISGTTNYGSSLPIYNSDATPNAGRVWSFNEVLAPQSDVNIYAKNINLNMNISKNTLTGSGNTAEAVLKYIHTYSAVKGTVSISPGSETVSGSFNLSNVDKQWSLVCTVTDIPY